MYRLLAPEIDTVLDTDEFYVQENWEVCGDPNCGRRYTRFMLPIRRKVNTKMIRPIRPSEVTGRKQIPDAVIEVFNELIVKNYRGGSAAIKQDEVVGMICKRMDCSREKPFEEHWLDIEGLYRRAGWKVEYDSPGYNETYPASYTFSKGNR